MIDWKDPECKVSEHFTVSECLTLPQWRKLAEESDGLDDSIKVNLENLCLTLDKVREFLGAPMYVHCMYRPEAYNKLVGGAANSSHKYGKAVDFHAKGISCDDVRAKLLPKLEEFGLRMEDKPGSSWVHLDSSAPRPNRFFKP